MATPVGRSVDRAGWWLVVRHQTIDPVPKIDKPGGASAPWGAGLLEHHDRSLSAELQTCPGQHRASWLQRNHGINNPLQSPHPRGLQVGMVDGSVQFISESLNFVILLRMAIRDDGGLFFVPD